MIQPIVVGCQLELNELATVCEEAIITDLCPANIIDELFSDFTWR